MRHQPMLVTVDGPAASGKSALARKLAFRLGVPYLYTGAMYRAVAWIALKRGLCLRSSGKLRAVARKLKMGFRVVGDGNLKVFVNGAEATRELQLPEVSLAASTHVARDAAIRRILVARQRRHLTRRGLVAEGRDCGSVVFPEASFKFFLTASVEARARRRREDLRKAGVRQSLARVLRETRRRDRQDRNEAFGTLQIQTDSWIIDNSAPGMGRALKQMLRRVKGRGL